MQHPPSIFIIYDGINNSVFQGQVLQPLINKASNNPEQHIILISFERSKTIKLPDTGTTPNLSIKILHQVPFVGSLSLWYASKQLKKVLAHFIHYELAARGPQ